MVFGSFLTNIVPYHLYLRILHIRQMIEESELHYLHQATMETPYFDFVLVILCF